METQVVIFSLAQEHYGVDIAAVDSIIKMQHITAVPHTPSFVEGVTNLRGKVLPVIDLRKRFGLPVSATSRETRIVVTEMEQSTVGMLVDAVSEVLHVSADAIHPPSPILSTADTGFITGIAQVHSNNSAAESGRQSRLVILLDLEQVLSPQERAELQMSSICGDNGNELQDE